MKGRTNFWEYGKKIVCVGRNYVEHAKELNNPLPKSPFFFLKPTTAYVRQPHPILLPKGADVHHEVELGVVMAGGGRDIPQESAMNHIMGYTLAIDLTARDQQTEAKSKGLPWTTAKGYDTFCPVSDFIPRKDIPAPDNVVLWLNVDGQQKQRGNTKDMVFNIPRLIAHISSIMTLEEGDLILTGTPAGVGPIVPGNVVTAGIEGVLQMKFPVESRV